MMISDASPRIDEVVGWPIAIVEAAPDRMIVIERDRIGDAKITHGLRDVFGIPFEGELGRVNADHDKAGRPVLRFPGSDIGKVRRQLMQLYVQKSTSTTLPRNASREWRGVQPSRRAGKRG